VLLVLPGRAIPPAGGVPSSQKNRRLRKRLTDDVGGIAYLEIPLGALERGMGLMSEAAGGSPEITVPAVAHLATRWTKVR
jgi:hypothetical protein